MAYPAANGDEGAQRGKLPQARGCEVFVAGLPWACEEIRLPCAVPNLSTLPARMVDNPLSPLANDNRKAGDEKQALANKHRSLAPLLLKQRGPRRYRTVGSSQMCVVWSNSVVEDIEISSGDA